MIKVDKKPNAVKPEQLKVTFEYEGKPHTIFIAPFGSARHYWASMSIKRDVEGAERTQAYCNYIADLIEGWDSPDFFGAEYSPEHARVICSNMDNHWMVKAIQDEMSKAQAK